MLTTLTWPDLWVGLNHWSVLCNDALYTCSKLAITVVKAGSLEGPRTDLVILRRSGLPSAFYHILVGQ